MYDDAQGVGFSMPAIEDDCVIDYTWEEITRPLLMPGQFLDVLGIFGPGAGRPLPLRSQGARG